MPVTRLIRTILAQHSHLELRRLYGEQAREVRLHLARALVGEKRYGDAKRQFELLLQTYPNNPDVDGDGLLDGDEVQGLGAVAPWGRTDPRRPDTDSDGLSDWDVARWFHPRFLGEHVDRAIVLPDVCPAGIMPNGTVAVVRRDWLDVFAFSDAIGDIGCAMSLARVAVTFDDLVQIGRAHV